MANECTNCWQNDDPVDICILSALAGYLVFGRESITQQEAKELMTRVNTDDLWEDLNDILDKLENGEYNLFTRRPDPRQAR